MIEAYDLQYLLYRVQLHREFWESSKAAEACLATVLKASLVSDRCSSYSPYIRPPSFEMHQNPKLCVSLW